MSIKYAQRAIIIKTLANDCFTMLITFFFDKWLDLNWLRIGGYKISPFIESLIRYFLVLFIFLTATNWLNVDNLHLISSLSLYYRCCKISSCDTIKLFILMSLCRQNKLFFFSSSPAFFSQSTTRRY